MNYGRFTICLWVGPLIVAGLISIMVSSALLDAGYTRATPYLKIGLFLGTLFGQTAVAAAWNAFGPFPLIWRFPLSIIWIALLAASPVLLVKQMRKEFFVFLGACLLAQWLVLQAPLWIVALTFRVRLRSREDVSRAGELGEQQFTIGQIMIFTAIVAVLFTVIRLLIANVSIQSMRFDSETVLIVFLACSAVATTLPLLLAALAPRWAVFAALVALALMALATLAEFSLAPNFMPRMATEFIPMFISINMVTATWILVFAAAVRLAGYRLARR